MLFIVKVFVTATKTVPLDKADISFCIPRKSPSSTLRYKHPQGKQSLDRCSVLSSWLLILPALATLEIAFMFVH